VTNSLIGKVIEAMEIDKHPPSQPVKGVVQSMFGNGTAIIVDQQNNVIQVRLQGAKVMER